MKNNETILSIHMSDQRVVVYNDKLKRLVTTLLCVRHASYWWTEPLHVKQRWGTVPRVHSHSRLTWHCFSKDWLPGPPQLKVNRQFSISRERGFISKSRGDDGREERKVKSSSLTAVVMWESNKVWWQTLILKLIIIWVLNVKRWVVKWFQDEIDLMKPLNEKIKHN